MTNQKPTYDELASALLILEDAWYDFFGQVCSNPVTNAWGQNVDFTAINLAREKTSGLVYRLKNAEQKFLSDLAEYKNSSNMLGLTPGPVASAEEAQSSSLQKYLEESDEYNFMDLVLEDMVLEEKRRQSKNCETVMTSAAIRENVRDEISYELREFSSLLFRALQRAATGKTKISE